MLPNSGHVPVPRVCESCLPGLSLQQRGKGNFFGVVYLTYFRWLL